MDVNILLLYYFVATVASTVKINKWRHFVNFGQCQFPMEFFLVSHLISC